MHERMRARMFGKELIVRTLTGVPQRLTLYSLFCFNPLIGVVLAFVYLAKARLLLIPKIKKNYGPYILH